MQKKSDYRPSYHSLTTWNLQGVLNLVHSLMWVHILQKEKTDNLMKVTMKKLYRHKTHTQYKYKKKYNNVKQFKYYLLLSLWEFFLGTAFTNHWVFRAYLIMGLKKTCSFSSITKIQNQKDESHEWIRSWVMTLTLQVHLIKKLKNYVKKKKTKKKSYLNFLKWNGSLQYLQLRVLSGHSLSLWRSSSLALRSSLHDGQGRILKSHFPSWFACER